MPDTNGHTNGASHPFGDANRRGRNGASPFSGMAKSLRDGDDVEEPIDLVAVQADDELISALAAGMSVSSATGSHSYHADDQVVALLSAWRADVAEEPIPDLVDLDMAVAAVQAGIKANRPTRSGRARHLVPVAAAAAFLVLVGGGVSIGSASAEPDSTLWPVSKMLFSERAASVEAAVRASDKIESAKKALTDGQPQAAAAELQQAQKELSAVRPQEGQAQLVDVKNFLVAKAAETPTGTKVDPATPLKTDRARPIPAGAQLSQAPAATGTVTPTPTTEEPAPASTTIRPTHSPRPKPAPPVTAATPTTPAPESPAGPTGGASSTTDPSATPEGSKDTKDTTKVTSSSGTTEESTTPVTETS